MSDRNGWVARNIGTVITVISLFVILVGQWTNFGQAADLSKAVDERLRIHELDNRRHLDPERDSERWAELMRRLDRIEQNQQRYDNRAGRLP